MFGMPRKGEIDYSVELELDLSAVQPAVAGPRRPQDRIDLPELGSRFRGMLAQATAEGGYGKSCRSAIGERFPIHLEERTQPTPPNGTQTTNTDESTSSSLAAPTDTGRGMEAATGKLLGETVGHSEMVTNRPTATPTSLIAAETSEPVFHAADSRIGHGSVLIAAITSCTNTSNPSVMLGAGLLAKKAVERGLKVNPAIKTSLAPGSRVVTDYLDKTGLQPYLDQLGFQIVGYGCTTCIGNSGPLHPKIEEAITEHDLIAASVLSGNRNFEARVHQNIKANFLMSPPLVVAFALAGRVDLDLSKDAIGTDRDGNEVFLRDIWPTLDEVRQAMASAAQTGNLPQALRGFRRAESEVERNSFHARRCLRLGRSKRLHPRTALLPEFLHGAGRDQRNPWRAAAGYLWRLGDDRPHFAGGRDQAQLTSGSVPSRARRHGDGFQQLRQPPGQ